RRAHRRLNGRFRRGIRPDPRYGFLQIRTQRQELLERTRNGIRRVIFLKRLAPVLAEVTNLNRGFRGGKASAAAIRGLNSRDFEIIERLLYRAQIRVEHSNECAAQQKVEPAEGHQRRRVVKHAAGGILQQAALFENALLEQIAQAMAAIYFRQHRLDGLAPFERRGVCLAEDRAEDACDVRKLDFAAVEPLRGTEREILNEQEINFVAVNRGLIAFLELAENKCPQGFLAGVQGLGRKLANLDGTKLLVNRVEPLQIAVEHLPGGPSGRQFAGRMRRR